MPNMRNREERIIRENHKHVCFKGVGASAQEIKDISYPCVLICVQKTSANHQKENKLLVLTQSWSRFPRKTHILLKTQLTRQLKNDCLV